jgi:hypothetical protein
MFQYSNKDYEGVHFGSQSKANLLATKFDHCKLTGSDFSSRIVIHHQLNSRIRKGN